MHQRTNSVHKPYIPAVNKNLWHQSGNSPNSRLSQLVLRGLFQQNNRRYRNRFWAINQGMSCIGGSDAIEHTLTAVNNAPIPLRISAPRFFPQLSLCRLPHTGGARKQNPFPLIRNHRTMEQKNITAKQNLLNANQMTAMQNSNRQFRNKTNRNLGKSNIKNVPMSQTTQSLRSTQK